MRSNRVWRVSLGLALTLPLVAVVALGLKTVRDDRALRREHERVLGETQLWADRRAVEVVIAARRAQLAGLGELASASSDTLRAWVRARPEIEAVFVLGADRRLVFPPPDATPRERAFLARTAQVWEARDVLQTPREGGVAPGGPASDREGWYAWFWENGLRLLYFQRSASGELVGAELNPSRLLADIIAALPGPESGAYRTQLVGPRGDVLHQWGPYAPASDEPARAQLALGTPLGAWGLRTFFNGAVDASLAWLGALAGLAALLLAATAAGFYAYREATREMRDAAQRVSFVSQVSHELKTPLTNIRMYAELLLADLEGSELAPGVRRRAEVITAETERLSRLITNVLTFARQQRGLTRVRRARAVLDEVVRAVVEQFAPALKRRGVLVELALNAPRAVLIDADVLGQVVANLLGNVEKYAPGAPVRLETSQSDGRARVLIADGGPGVPEAQREQVFAPFVRLDDRIAAGVTGAGIGLTLSRELCRAHGGDLEILPSAHGACFALTCEAPLAEDT